MTLVKRIGLALIWLILFIWIIGGLGIHFKGNFVGKWSGIFPLQNSPGMSAVAIILLAVLWIIFYRKWTILKLLRHFLVGLWGPLLVILFLALLSIPGRVKLRDFGEYPWKIIFTVGILVSLWAQLSASAYFRARKLSTSIEFPNQILDTAEEIIKFAMVLCVLAALFGMLSFGFHILLSLTYLGLVYIWDFAIVKWSKAVDDNRSQKCERYKKYCTQLLWHVDGIVFFIVLIWIGVIQLFIASDARAFSFVSEVTSFLRSYPQDTMANLDQLSTHGLEEPLMGGIIGFHSILSMGLLIVHFRDWESDHDQSVVADTQSKVA